ncbi:MULTISPECIES: hypothetical protein [unclassified Exiguobacterium]|uniref:hypothetical protein n=2 Tax=Exiguobacterium TaxID=33986 RepID=UPI001BE83FA8|nr:MULTISPECIES: hypothetical protein [unclassified Exiguobacterium]
MVDHKKTGVAESDTFDPGQGIFGILDLLERFDVEVAPADAVSLLKKGIFIDDLLSKKGKSLPGVPATVRRALIVLQSVMGDKEIKDMCKTRTLYHLLLPETGLLVSDIELMRDAGLTYKDLEGLDLESFQAATGGGRRPGAYERVMRAYDTFEGRKPAPISVSENVLDDARTEDKIEDKTRATTVIARKIDRKGLVHTFYQTIYDRLDDVFSTEDVMSEIDRSGPEVSVLLEEMSRSAILSPTQDGFFKKRTRMLKSILSSELPHMDLLRERLEQGLTPHEIARLRGLKPRFVMRQLREILDTIPVTSVKEGKRYLKRFVRFDIPEDIFVEVFAEPPMVHRFLSSKVRMGTDDVMGLYNRLDDAQRHRFRSYLSVIVGRDGSISPATKTSVFEHVLWLHADDTARPIEEWKDIYDRYILEEFDVITVDRLRADVRSLSAIGSRSDVIIPSAGRRLRFHDTSVLTQRRLQRLRGLIRLEPGFYSTEHIFGLSPDLMDELDCRDHEELHYIIRKHVEMTNVTPGRQPEIAIGTMGKAEWLKKMIRQNAPIDIEAFLTLIQHRFGLSPKSVRQVLRRELPDYLSPDGTIGHSMSLLTKREAAWFSRRLTKEIYTYEELEQAFSHIENFTSRYLNSGALEKVGFVNRGGLVLRAGHPSAEAYFQKLLTREDFFSVPDSPAFKTAPFKRVIKRLEDGHDIFRFDDNTYIHIARLRKAGINKGMVRGFIRQMVDAAKEIGTGYFTIASIRVLLDSPILELGLEDIFFEGLLHTQTRLGAIRTGKGDIFYMGRDKRTLGRFLLDLLPETDGLDADTIREEILQTYHLEFDRNAIISNVRGRGGYFSPDTGKLYRDKELFLDSIFKS